MNASPPLKIGGLFAGYGGLEMGVGAVLDTELSWVSEIDPGACKVIAHRFPGVPNIGDITKVDWTAVEPVDILTGGSPCQDLSHAGKRAGMTEGTRSNLWVAMREAIAVLRPRLVVWENVRGAYSASADSAVEPCPGCVGDGSTVHLRALGRVLGDLSDLGYDAQWHGLRAADVGAPHGRFRVFVAAVPADQRHEWCRASRDGWAGPADGDRRPVALYPTPTARDHKGHNQRRDDTCLTGALLPTPAVNDMGEGKTVEDWDAWTAKMQAKHGNGNGHGASLAIEAQRITDGNPVERYLERVESMHPDAVLQRRINIERDHEERWGRYADAITRWEALTRPAPAPTEIGPKGNPRVSARLSEWMMGLPDGWITGVPGITRNEALKLAGNGVVSQQAAAALRIMLARAEAVAP